MRSIACLSQRSLCFALVEVRRSFNSLKRVDSTAHARSSIEFLQRICTVVQKVVITIKERRCYWKNKRPLQRMKILCCSRMLSKFYRTAILVFALSVNSVDSIFSSKMFAFLLNVFNRKIKLKHHNFHLDDRRWHSDHVLSSKLRKLWSSCKFLQNSYFLVA